MQSQLQKIQDFLTSYLDPELINSVTLPEDFLDPGTEEQINERFYFIYHKLFGALCVTLMETLKMKLSKTEIGFISERLQVYMKEQGL